MTVALAPRRSARVLPLVLFGIYAVLLVLIVLLKYPFNGPGSEAHPMLNLVPFKNTFTSRTGDVQVAENILAFVPLGLYLSMLWPRSRFVARALVIVGTTIAFETLQYFLEIGRADITDVIDNTVGGLLGIALYALLARTLKSKANLVTTIVMAIFTVAFLAFSLRLFIHAAGSFKL